MAAGAGSVALSTYGEGASAATTTNAVANAATDQQFFYGMNGHIAWNAGIYNTLSAFSQLAQLKDLGCTMYRADVASDGMSDVIARLLTGVFAASGVQILPVLNAQSAGWSHTSSEADSYALGYKLGVDCARPLKGLVKYIECGNELDVNIKIGGDGSSTADWDPNTWGAFRGVTRGMIDGVKAVDSSIQVGVNVGIPMAYRALQMLWAGISPDGSEWGRGGASSIRWDFTTYHWYKSSYDIQRAGRTASVDVLQILKDSFGVPIWLTEWGWSGSQDTPESAAEYVTTAMTQYRSIKDQYNIQCIMMYCIIDDNYGLINPWSLAKSPAYYAFRRFVRNNPV